MRAPDSSLTIFESKKILVYMTQQEALPIGSTVMTSIPFPGKHPPLSGDKAPEQSENGKPCENNVSGRIYQGDV
jgi:hypothetical protein